MSNLFYETRPEKMHIGGICDHPFPMHLHEVIEIVYLSHGKITMTIGDTTKVMLPGHVALSFPFIPHSYDAVSDDAQGLSLIFDPTMFPEFESIFLQTMPSVPILDVSCGHEEIHFLIQRMIDLKLTNGHHLSQGYLHLFLSYLIPFLQLKTIQQFASSSTYSQVLRYISDHYTEPITLESTAKALGISAIHLSHIFSQQFHINFRQYINSLRINQSCVLLQKTQYSISEIAYQCGYGNPRTFHRAFLLHCNMTPKEYRRKFIQQF